MPTPRVEKLDRRHDVAGFDCGTPALNLFLARHALQSQSANATRTWVACSGEKVHGFYSLTVGQVARDEAPERMGKGLARHPIPVMILARLAVDRSWMGRGLGAALLKDALRRTAAAADIAGIRAVVVHAKDEGARRFYVHFDFTPFEREPFHLYLLTKQFTRLF